MKTNSMSCWLAVVGAIVVSLVFEQLAVGCSGGGGGGGGCETSWSDWWRQDIPQGYVEAPSVSDMCVEKGKSISLSVSSEITSNGTKQRRDRNCCDTPCKEETEELQISEPEIKWWFFRANEETQSGSGETATFTDVHHNDWYSVYWEATITDEFGGTYSAADYTDHFDVGVADPDPNVSTTVNVDDIVGAIYKGPAQVLREVLKVVPQCSAEPPQISGEIVLTEPETCCEDEVRKYKKVTGSVKLSVPKFSCAIPGLGYKYRDWFWIGVTASSSAEVGVSVSVNNNPCNGTLVTCVEGEAKATAGFDLGAATRITACTVDIHGSVSSTASITASACSPGKGADVLFKLEPMSLSGTCTVRTAFFECKKETPIIPLTPEIKIPIRFDSISL